MTTLPQKYDLAQAYATAVAANAAKRAAEAAAYRAILCGDGPCEDRGRHTPKVEAAAPTVAQMPRQRIDEMSDDALNLALFG